MPDLEDLLADLTSGNEERAEAAVPGLMELGEKVIPSLQSLLCSIDADIRWWATRALASLPNLDPALLMPSLADSTAEVRQCAALGLCGHPADMTVDALVHALSDDDNLVAELAAKALITVGAPAVEKLLQTLKDAPQSARIHAMHALAEIADPKAIPDMIAAMSEESVLLQYWADKGLDKLGVNMVYFKP